MQALTPIHVPKHRFFDPAQIAPHAPFWAVGDVHGRYDLFAPLLDQLIATGEHIVLLGDMINKGPDSAAVLRLAKQAMDTGQVTALRGNHEALLIRWFERPRIETTHMLLYDGKVTLDSFGVTGLRPDMALWQMSNIRNDLLEAMDDLADWIKALPFWWLSGNVATLHAGADPTKPLQDQPEIAFAWGHPHFDKKPRTDGVWVVHGHRPVEEITIKAGRIALETQAFATGRLSAVRISHGQIATL